WNVTSIKNKIFEFHTFLIDHNADIAINHHRNLAHPKKTLKIPNYKIHRQDGPLTINNKSRGGVLIAKNISTEDTPRPASSNIEILTIKTRTTPSLMVEAAYPPPPKVKYNKINSSDLDAIILP
ncbi:hypothetical protein WN51_05518, partial [Melipona quadrifasciata]